MIFVLFHVLHFLGKLVYKNFFIEKPKANNDSANKPSKLLNVSEACYNIGPSELTQCDRKMPIKFFPPLYIQRYVTVQSILASDRYQGKLRKIVDFGCSGFGFVIHLKNTIGVQEILCVDVDRQVLEAYQEKVAPLHADYLHIRSSPLTIHVYEGSITENDKILENCDAVVCIELIEHLNSDTLMDVPQNIFGYIKPQVAVITTPNADFNVLFDNFTGVRNVDHKFEWTRRQFQDWAENIVLRYPQYEVTFQGIGNGPRGTENLGFCTQIAVFHRLNQFDGEKVTGIEGLYKTVVSYEFPCRIDNRSDEEKILDEALYYIRLFSGPSMDSPEEIPLEKLLQALRNFYISIERLKDILEEAHYTIVDREDGPVVLVPQLSTFSDYADEMENFLDHDYLRDDDDWNDQELGSSVIYSNNYDPSNVEENWSDLEDWNQDPTIILGSGDNVFESEAVLRIDENISANLEHHFDDQWNLQNLDYQNDLDDLEPALDDIQSELSTSLAWRDLDEIIPDDLNILNNSSFSSESVLSRSIPLSSFPNTSSDVYENMQDSTVTSGHSPTTCLQLENHGSCSNAGTTSDFNVSLQVESDNDISFVNNFSPNIKTTQLHLQTQPLSALHLSKNSSLKLLFPSVLLQSKSNDTNCSSNNEGLCSNDRSTIENEVHQNVMVEQLDENHEESSSTTIYKFPWENSRTEELSSLCSMYLEPSYDSSRENYFESMKDSLCTNIDDTINECSTKYFQNNPIILNDTDRSDDKIEVEEDSLSTMSITSISTDLKVQPQCTSSPQVFTKSLETSSEKYKSSLYLDSGEDKVDEENKKDNLSCVKEMYPCSSVITSETTGSENLLESTSQTSLQSGSNISTSTTSSHVAIGKWYQTTVNPMYQRELVTLKGGNDMADEPYDETTSDSDVPALDSHTDEEKQTTNETEALVSSSSCKVTKSDERVEVTPKKKQLETCKVDEKLEDASYKQPNISLVLERRNVDVKDVNVQSFSEARPKTLLKLTEGRDETGISSVTTTSNVDCITSVLAATLKLDVEESANMTRHSNVKSKDTNQDSTKDLTENIEAKSVSSKTLDTPPNSWSPEIVDSGYPNSSSAQDMTPEYDLSSIANDRISDSESPSFAEAPRLGFLELVEVENGDVANNNRDDEGNNMVAAEADDLEDLQPLIDVLEHDLENENDIYVLQNGFPMWLLRILEMANPIDIEDIGLDRHAHPPPVERAAGGDAPNVNADDEGFDSSSSDDDSDVNDDDYDDYDDDDDDDDDNDNEDTDDFTSASSGDTEDENVVNNIEDWRAGGDP